MKQKLEYLIISIISLILFEIGFFYAWAWYWSGFEWSPLGYETCGLEFLAIIFFTWPAFALAMLSRGILLIRWHFPHFAWYIPLFLSAAASCAFAKSFEMGIFCIVSMLVLPIVDIFAAKRAVRRKKNC